MREARSWLENALVGMRGTSERRENLEESQMGSSIVKVEGQEQRNDQVGVVMGRRG